MAHGQPDFGVYAAKTTTYGLADMAELAARLGSINTFDRRGDVIWMDDFEASHLNKWSILSPAGSGALSTEKAKSGAQSVKCVTGAVADDYVQMLKYFPYPVLSKAGIEVWVSHLSLSDQDLLIFCYLNDGTNRYESRLKYTLGTGRVDIWDENGAYVQVGTVLMAVSGIQFNFFKLVSDFINKTYAHIIINSTLIDVSAYPLYSVASASTQVITASILPATLVATAKTSYVDDFIYTQNEP